MAKLLGNPISTMLCFYPLTAADPLLDSQGNEINPTWRPLKKKAEAHWSERSEVLLAATEPKDDLLRCPVSPNRTYYVSTQYVYVGKGRPLPFELEDD